MLLRLMLRNLLENAGRYSPAGTTITVTLTEVETAVRRLSVIDQVPVLMKRTGSQLPSRFVVLTSAYGGSGWAWSIVQRILQLHHGKLTL